MLKITYYGHSTFRFESEETSLLLNPGVWDGEPLIASDHDVRMIAVTNHCDDALGNATEIAANSKAWVLGNKRTIEKVESQGGKPWLLHVLKSEEVYEIPGLKVTPFSLRRRDPETGEKVENLGLYIEMAKMKIAYLGDTLTRGTFGQLETDLLIAPVGGNDVFEVKDATSLSIDVQPRLAIPMRWTAPEQPKKFAKYIEQFGRGTTPILMESNQVLELDWAGGNEFRYTLN